jgi:hypothetical protein
MARPDISKRVIHFTRGVDWEDAFSKLWAIASQRRFLGGTGMIRGGYRCVCFTEAPLSSLASGFVNADSFSRYSPFGVMVDKAWLFARGGRPVIYQPSVSFNELPGDLQWRYVRYDPVETPPVDFTWEREWRVQCDELDISASAASLVVPTREWAERFVKTHEAEQDIKVERYSTVLDADVAQQYRDPTWRVVSLS